MKKIERPSNKSKKIRKGDKVVAIAGNNRGKSGTVLSCSGEKVLVQGLNVRKKHVKPSKKNPQGGIIEINQKIDISKMMIICGSCGKHTKIAYKVSEKGKMRVCKKCNQSLEGGK